MTPLNLLHRWLVLLAALIACGALWAMPEDRYQVVEIESDYAELDDANNRSTLRGNVIIRQGSIVISADEVTTYWTGNDLTRIVSTGTPAQFQQKMAEDGQLVTARAKRIEYRLNEDVVELRQAANLSQSGSTVSGEEIDFDLRTETMKAKGSKSGKARVHVVIQPPKRDDQSPQDKTAPDGDDKDAN